MRITSPEGGKLSRSWRSNENERESLEKEMKSDIEVRTKSLREEAERASLSDLDRRFRAERDSMEAALALRRQNWHLRAG